MPQVRKLAPEEVQAIQNKGKGQRKLVEEEYDAILSEYSVGEYGEAILAPDENRLTIRNRLRAAAARRDLGILFRRTSGDLVRFQVILPIADAPKPAVATEPTPTGKRKGGRPRKLV